MTSLKGGTAVQLLLVEDDGPLASTLASFLEGQGWQVVVARDGLEAMHAFRRRSFSVVTIDWVLPPHGPSGIELCAEMRQLSSNVGIMFVTGKAELGDRLLAFKAGADDYLVKPFERDEYLARARAVARRSTLSALPLGALEVTALGDHSGGTAPGERILICGSITVDLATLRVTVDQQEVDLSLRQLLILIYLMRHKGRLVPEGELRSQVLRSVTAVQTSTIRNHIHQLRDRLGPAKALIRSVHGRGYGIGLSSGSAWATSSLHRP